MLCTIGLDDTREKHTRALVAITNLVAINSVNSRYPWSYINTYEQHTAVGPQGMIFDAPMVF